MTRPCSIEFCTRLDGHDVEVTASFYPPSPATRDYPGDDGEIEFESATSDETGKAFDLEPYLDDPGMYSARHGGRMGDLFRRFLK